MATFKDGLRCFYQPFTVLVNNHTEYRPYQVEDTNGNFISITYTNPNNLNINTITDTVGRVIQFAYDSTGTMLQSVAELDSTGHVFRQYTFGWALNQPLTFNFTLNATAGLGLPPGVLTSGQRMVNLLNKVTRPDGTVVSFDYVHDGSTNGNPDWGIIKTITELSSSNIARYTTSYTFPAASAGALVSNPTYTQQAVNDGVNNFSWGYQTTATSGGLVTSSVTTDPCGNKITTTFSANGDALDGLPIKETMASPQTPLGVMPFGGCPTSSAETWRTVNKTWTTDADGGNARSKNITSILEDGSTQSQVTYNTYDANGQPTDVLEYNLGANGPGPLVKEVVTTFASLGNGIVNHPSEIIVKDGKGNTVFRTDFNYDDYSNTPIKDLSPNPPGHDAAFTSSNTVRGNLTSMIRYANASAAGGGITSTFAYDAAGNSLAMQDGCCTFQQRSFSAATNYAHPDSVSSGPSGNSLSLTTNFTYNQLTGTLASVTDPNGQITRTSYDLDDRLTQTTLPDTATISYAYDDASASRSTTVSNSFNRLVQITTAQGPNLTQQVKNGTSVVSTKTTQKDVLGRTIAVSNPYGMNETPLYTTYQYDPIGRILQITPPGNTGSYQASYGIVSTSMDAETHMITTVTSTDPAGKQRKTYTDSVGLRQVDEPGQSGGQAGSGSISISGTEQSTSVQSGGGATAGTGSVTLSGQDRSTVVLTHAATQASVTVTIGGANRTNVTTVTTCIRLSCTSHTFTSADSGNLQLSVNAGGTILSTGNVPYGGSSTPASLASGLFGQFPGNSLVSINNPNGGATFTLTAITPGSAGNNFTVTTSATSNCISSDTVMCGGVGWGMSLSGPGLSPTSASTANFTGGSDNVNTTMYDMGTVSVNVTINGTVYSKSSTYGQNSAPNSIALDLASQINSDITLNQLLIANAANGVLNLTTTATGNNTNDPLSVSSVTSSPYFSSGSTSFSATPSGATLTPGQNGTIYDAGTVTVKINDFTATPYQKSANYSQGSTATSIASSLAGAFNSDSVSPVTASPSGGSIILTAKNLGADTSYGIQISSASTQTAYFSQPSFGGASTMLSGGQDPTASLATPLSTYYTYDVLGYLLQVSQGQQSRSYGYDSLGQLTSSKIPETQGIATSYTYTDFGAIYQRTDPRGIVTTYTYDALDRLYQITYSDGTPTVTYTFGGQGAANFGGGHLTKVVDASGTLTLGYDLMGRTTQASRAINGQTYPIAYAYANEELSRVTYPSGRTVNMTPDDIGRLSQIASNGASLFNISSYNAAGKILAASYGNGMAASYTYNSQLQLASLVSGSGSTLVLNLTYNYGAQDNGQIQGITDGITTSQSTSYIYDELGRLKIAQTNDLTSANTWKFKFSYDRYGNRLAEIPAAGTASMPFSEISVDPTTNHIIGLQYDASGNMTNDGAHAYTFNAENQIKQVDAAGSYVYDAGGHRTIKNGTVYIYDRGQVIAEYPNGAAPGSPSVEYVGKLASFAGGGTTYYYSDRLSIRALADASGNVTGRQSHYPFGELITGLQTGAATKWQFTTYERDLAAGDSGLDYANARFYGNRFGRFASLDPISGSIGDPQSLNKYVYAANDPINSADPSGMLHGRLACPLDSHGDCIGGNGYAPGGGGWGDVQLDMHDTGPVFGDPFGPWIDPTAWNPLAEGEARYDRYVHEALYQAGGGNEPNPGDPDVTEGDDTRPCSDSEQEPDADACVHADAPQIPIVDAPPPGWGGGLSKVGLRGSTWCLNTVVDQGCSPAEKEFAKREHPDCYAATQAVDNLRNSVAKYSSIGGLTSLLTQGITGGLKSGKPNFNITSLLVGIDIGLLKLYVQLQPLLDQQQVECGYTYR
jgi:RHS repeat-associated protein